MPTKPNSSSYYPKKTALLFHMISLMDAMFRVLLFLSVFYVGKAQTQQSNITTNSSLSPSTNSFSWPSPSGRYAFGFYPQGNGFAVGVWLLSGASGNIVVWTAKRDDPPVPRDAILLLTPNGRLILRSRGQDTPISNGTESASSASMLDTGNFVLYNSKSQIIWQSFDSPTDTILPGQLLLSDNELISSANENNHSSGRFRLKMQTDGNLVSYPIQTMDTTENSYWSTNTNNERNNNVTLHLNSNGLLFLRNNTGSYVYNLTDGFNTDNERTATIIYRATLDFEGIFRLYSHRFETNSSTVSEEWSSIFNKCAVRGFCGFNSYCFLSNGKADCSCPRGFVFVDPNQSFLGCDRNFIAEGCGGKKQNITYDVELMKNTVWVDNSYTILQLMSEDSCRDACLQDCQCEAAMFKDGNCNKQKLPLRYGIRRLDEPTTAIFKFGMSSTSWDGNSEPKPSKRDLPGKTLVVIIALIAIFFVVLGVSGVLFCRHRIRRHKFLPETQNFSFTGEELAPRSFTYHELEIATDGFKEELGKGAFGTVYKGTLSNGKRMVAVKRLDNRVVEEGEREFQTEMRAIGRTHHRNLVQLLGFCAEGPHRLLVYEYMSNGSLAEVLFSTAEKRPNWNERVKIAMDIARGMLYLHEECETPIIHCDIKPQNILMDESYCAKISDFGLAKLMKPDQTKTFTGIRGTRGYVAPEWHRSMPVTVKADVYSFGIVLLEIVCCRRCVDMEAKEEEKILCHWVYDCFEAGELGKLVDTSEEVDKRSVEGMVKVGLWCIQDKPSLRPSMKRVVLMLEGNIEIPIPPSVSFLDSL